MKTNIILAALLTLAAFPLGAQQSQDHSAHPGHPAPLGASAEQAASWTEGEVRKVDLDAKKITIRHGALENLSMPPMTMVFQVQNPKMLETVKAGDKIRFVAEKQGGAFVVTRIEAAQ